MFKVIPCIILSLNFLLKNMNPTTSFDNQLQPQLAKKNETLLITLIVSLSNTHLNKLQNRSTGSTDQIEEIRNIILSLKPEVVTKLLKDLQTNKIITFEEAYKAIRDLSIDMANIKLDEGGIDRPIDLLTQFEQ